MNVLSLCNGMSCGRIALEMLGAKVDKYYSSEVDKYANQVTQAMYPEIIQLGDIAKWLEWELPKIDLILAGTPCTGFSFAGKGLNFEDPQSKLFFDFVDILKHYKPKHFLLENVIMKAEHNDTISSILGEIYPECVSQFDLFGAGRLEPVEINSALLSAQNRRRLFWINWKVGQPEDKGILLKDILDYTCNSEDHILSEKAMQRMERKKYSLPKKEPLKTGAINTKNNSGQLSMDGGTTLIPVIKSHGKFIYKPNKAQCLDANYHKGLDNHGQRTGCIKTYTPRKTPGNGKCIHVGDVDGLSQFGVTSRVYSPEGESPTIRTMQGGNLEPKVACGAFRDRYLIDGKRQDYKGLTADKTEQRLELREDGKTNTITSVQKDNVIVNETLTWRKLTPRECGRLQTVPEDKLDIMLSCGVSNSQLYRQFGNGWTCAVIAHILKPITKDRA